MIAFFLITTFS